jgi:hypothetical protein
MVSAFILLVNPLIADAGVSSELSRRLCDRQDVLGSRLTRWLINPKHCDDAPETPTLKLSANHSSIKNPGKKVKITWSAKNADSCTASGAWSGTKDTSGKENVFPTVTSTYTLTCTGEGGEVTKSVTVKVKNGGTPTPEPTLTFTANPTAITSGGTSDLSWSSTNATSCTASDGWSGAKATSGTQAVTPSATTTYTLTCEGAGGDVTESVTVNVSMSPNPTPSITFTADPTSVLPNGTSTLTWSSANVTFCAASNGWTGTKATNGTQQVNPSATSTYALSCGGQFGTTTASVTVNVTPNPEPTVTLTADPTMVTGGSAGNATTTLTWSSTNASSCTAFGGWTGPKGLSGSEIVTPSATTTYQLDCTGPGGVGSDDATVDFIPSSTPTPNPTLSISANPTNVTPGPGSASSTLTWSSSNASACEASGGWSGSRGVSGSEIVTPAATTTYTLLCGNGTASTSESVTVNFVPTPVTPTGKLLITEVMYDLTTSTTSPQGAESANEWVELYNGTNSAIDLGGYFIGDASSTDVLPSVVLPAGAFAIVSASSTTETFWDFPEGTVVIVLATNIGQNGFGNGGDMARLLDTASTTIDAVSWGTDTTAFNPSVPTFTANAGDSIGRISLTTDTDTASDWERKMEPSPGQVN